MSGGPRAVVVFGIGGHGREVMDLLEACRDQGQELDPVGFLVDPERAPDQREVNGWPVLGGPDWLVRHRTTEVIVGIGAPEHRRSVANRLTSMGARFASAVHPAATMTRRVSMGEGCIVMAGARLTNNIRLGDHVHVTQNCTVAHDAWLEDFVSIYPGATISGNVHLGPGVLIGAGATLVEKVEIGSWTRVGAGSTVLRSAGSDETLVGVPAKVVRRRQSGWHLDTV